MGFIMRNESFVCQVCGAEVSEHPNGSARNHCPACLASLHVDGDMPGDRASSCVGIMKPIGFEERKGKGMVVVHQCQKCKKRIVNKLAPDDEYLPVVRTISDIQARELLE